jgi:hypothetical protein
VRDDPKATAAIRDEIVHEFLAQPGLKLTFHQARRLWNLTPDRCMAVLESLVRDQVLEITFDGGYRRASASTRRTA